MRDHTLAGWRSIPFDWAGDALYGHIYRAPSGKAAVLELDGFVQMQVLEVSTSLAPSELQSVCARTLRRRALAGRRVWSCHDWSVSMVEGEPTELWWVAR
jgi:hypothetical protein